MTSSAAPLHARHITGVGEPPLLRFAPWFVALAAVLVYANSLSNGLVLDDEGIILRNDVVHHASGIWRAFITPYWPNGSGQYRPLVIASFSAEWSLWGSSPAGYHALNVVWHAATSVLLFALARRWFSVSIALLAGLLFAVHPVHTEAVANVVGRGEVMAACGVMAMLLLHAQRSGWAIAAFAFALLSKEHAIVAPALALGMDTLGRDRIHPESRRVFALYGGYVAVATLWGGVVFMMFRDAPFANVDPFWASMSAPSRVMTMLGVIPVWIRLWFFPLDLSADYSPAVTPAWPEQAGLAVAGVAMLVALAVLAFRLRHRLPVVSFAVLLLGVAMFPVANLVVPTGVIVAERTLYLSSAGAVLLIAAAAASLSQGRKGPWMAIAVVVVLAGGVRTWLRNPVWRSNRDLLLTTAERHPEGSWTHAQLGRVFAANGGFAQATDEYRRSLSIFDRNPVIWSDGINAAINAGKFALADSMVVDAERAVPNHYLIKVAHAHAAFESARFAEALEAARAAIGLGPDSVAPRFFAGLAWTGLRVTDSAVAAFERVPSGHPYRPMTDSVLKNLRGRE